LQQFLLLGKKLLSHDLFSLLLPCVLLILFFLRTNNIDPFCVGCEYPLDYTSTAYRCGVVSKFADINIGSSIYVKILV